MYQKYNLGCGVNYIEGFININAGWNVLLSKVPWIKKPLFKLGLIPEGMLSNLDKRIRYGCIPQALRKIKSGSADRVCSSALLEHLTKDNALLMLSESFRILCPNGLMRIVAPDTVLVAKLYLENTETCIREGRDTTEHRDYFFTNIAEGLVSGDKNAHRFIWDIPSIRYTLEQIGFTEVTVCSYQKSVRDPAMAQQVDSYPQLSFFIEAVRPDNNLR